MNQWQLWLQLALGAIGTVNPEIAAIVQMIGNGVLTIQGDTAEDKALIEGWRAYCQRMIDGSVSIEDARAAARAFADATHANNQSLAAGGPPVEIPPPPA
jgi:hypothetical protein